MVLPGTPTKCGTDSSSLLARKGLQTLSSTSSKALSSFLSFPGSPIPFSPVTQLSASIVEEYVENAEAVITKWDPNSSSATKSIHLFHLNHRDEAKVFLHIVKDLRRAMDFLVSQRSNSDKLVRAQNYMKMAMSRLEKEFYQILSTTHDRLDPESVSGKSSESSCNFDEDGHEAGSKEESKIMDESISEAEKASALAMLDLKAIADCMVSSGYGKECVKIYKLIRKSVVHEGLHLLRIEQYKSSQIQKMSWEALEHAIKNWMQAVKIVVKTLFHREKVLCDHFFSSSQRIRESCFSDIAKEGATNLFKFPELIAMRKTFPEKAFSLLELYEVLSYLLPEIDLIFNSEPTSAIKMQALSSLHGLGESVSTILSDFELTIQKDSTKTPIEGGGVHPLTDTVMNYISSLADYSTILSDIVVDSPPKAKSPTCFPESFFGSPTSDNSLTPTVSTRLAWFILVLLCKLDIKAEVYKDRSLSYLFMANNLQFIIEKVCTSRLRFLLGEDWVFKHAKKVIQYASNYEAIAWGHVFSSLPQGTSPEVSPQVAKESFKRFNAAFEEAFRKQRACIVHDGKLRDELKKSIAHNILPAYTEFYKRYLTISDGDNTLSFSVRFAPEDLKSCLSDLFHGADSSSATQSRGRISQ